MNIEREETGALTATLKLTLTPEDYAPGVEKALKEQRRNATWPGFRPGQVPMTIVKKRVGKAVLVHEVERLIGDRLNSYLRDNGVRVLGQPLPSHDATEANDWDNPGELKFKYDMGLAPSFEVELDPKLGVEMAVVDVTEELVGREVADMQRRFGRLATVDRSADKDMLLGDLIELDATGAVVPGGLMNRTTISLEFLKDDNARALLTGRAPGEEVVVAADAISDGHDDLARMFNTDHDRVHHLAGQVRFRIEEIKRLEPLPLGPELFDRVYGQGAVADEQTFRARVKEGLEAMFQRDAERLFKRAVMKRLHEQVDIGLPDAFLKRWIVETSEKPVAPEDVEQGYAGYAEGLKRQLLEDRVVEKYGLEAKGEELDAFAKRYVADQFGQYGMPAPEGEELQRMAGRLLTDRDQIKRMRDTIVDRKLTVHFRTMLQPKERRVSYEEFVTLARTP
ncbi:MAG: hypothetical protein IT228_10675 [Flavobacteriales bacterium]|nr:Trigger factor [Flavobacteriales bacterium]MCC6577794.1 hypothetical protein [Flavobacteriales bacterium]NUQ15311.1 hypothetical protein [Flavobacteriales bacterium]